MTISLERVQRLIDDLHEQYQREEEQAILQRDMEKAVRALSGKDACTRLKNYVGMGVQMDATVTSMQQARRRR